MVILTLIFMTAIGAMFGAFMRDEYLKRKKPSVELESKTPYDYALTNAINERDRLQGELVTIQALKRTEADTERIRNEIDTILPDGGEEVSEDVYEPNIGMPIQDNGDGTFSPITWDARMSLEEWAKGVSKAFASGYGTHVREDDSEDEQLTEDDVERSLIDDIIDKASENLELAVEFAKMTIQDDDAIRKQLEETSKELAEEIRDARRRMREFREEGKYYGETLYRKGNR